MSSVDLSVAFKQFFGFNLPSEEERVRFRGSLQETVYQVCQNHGERVGQVAREEFVEKLGFSEEKMTALWRAFHALNRAVEEAKRVRNLAIEAGFKPERPS